MYLEYNRYEVGEQYATGGFLHKDYLADASNCSLSYV